MTEITKVGLIQKAFHPLRSSPVAITHSGAPGAQSVGVSCALCQKQAAAGSRGDELLAGWGSSVDEGAAAAMDEG